MTNPAPRAQNGKGSKPRPVNKSKYDNAYDQINWLTKKRRGGKSEVVFKSKRDYDRKWECDDE